MATILTFLDREQPQLRSAPQVTSQLTLYRRVYEVEPESILIPAKGSSATLAGITASGIMLPRVLDVSVSEVKGSSNKRVTVIWYQIRQYTGTPTGNGTELLGGRRTWGEGYRRYAERLFVTNDGSTGVPARGDNFPGDSGLFARKCIYTPSCTPEGLPGLSLHHAVYAGLIAY